MVSDDAPSLRFDAPIGLIGGGLVGDAALARVRRRASALLAADGGANRFSKRKADLAAVIGDLDSLENAEAWRAALGERVLHIAEQDSTDFEKCLYSVSAPLYLAVGFLGGRFDHAIAALHVLLKRSDRRVILVEDDEILFLAPRRWRIDLPPGERLSVAPLRHCRAVRSGGLRWPLDGLTLELGARIGTSNETLGGAVEIEFVGDGDWSEALVALDAEHLDATIASLGAAT